MAQFSARCRQSATRNFQSSFMRCAILCKLLKGFSPKTVLLKVIGKPIGVRRCPGCRTEANLGGGANLRHRSHQAKPYSAALTDRFTLLEL